MSIKNQIKRRIYQNIRCRYRWPRIIGQNIQLCKQSGKCHQEGRHHRTRYFSRNRFCAHARTILPPVRQFGGYRVTAAYPRGSNDIKSSVDRIPGYTEDVKKLGVERSGLNPGSAEKNRRCTPGNK